MQVEVVHGYLAQLITSIVRLGEADEEHGHLGGEQAGVADGPVAGRARRGRARSQAGVLAESRPGSRTNLPAVLGSM